MHTRIKGMLMSAALIVMSSFCVSGCVPKNIPDEGHEESAIVELPSTTSREANLYVLSGKIVDSEKNAITDYVLDEEKNIVDKDGKIFIASNNTEEYGGFKSVSFSGGKMERNERISAELENNGHLSIEAKSFEIFLVLQPTDALDRAVIVESTDPAAVYFPYDSNKEFLAESAAEPEDNAMPAVCTELTANSVLKVNVVACEEGLHTLVVRDGAEKIIGGLNIEIEPEFFLEPESDSDSQGMEEAGVVDTEDEAEVVENEEKVHEHEFEDAVVEPTESHQGFNEHKCKSCGYTYRDTYVFSTMCEHQYKEEKVSPTYVTHGYTIHTCIICGDNYCDQETDPIVCNHKKTADTVVKPTCHSPGYTLHECLICHNYSFIDSEAETLEHRWNNGVITRKATCAEAGERTYTCRYCKETKTEEIPATGKHSYREVVTRPTCTTDGYSTFVCSVCGDEYIGNHKEAYGHKKTLEWTVTKRATCAEDGEKTGVCPWCKEVIQTEIIPATGKHKYESKTIRPTKTEDGYTEYTCSVCGDSYRDKIVPATGNNN